MTTSQRLNNQGQILLFAVVFMGILLTMATSVVSYSLIHLKAERQADAQTQALELAEAGLDQAIYKLNQDGGFTGESNVSLGVGTYTTTITSIDSNDKQITSTGNVNYGTNSVAIKTVKAVATIDYQTVSFRAGVQVGNGGLIMNNGSQVKGNVYSSGSISGSGTITGSAIVAAGTSAAPDQSWTTQNADFFFGNVSTKTAVAQSFIPSATNTINKVSLYIKKVGSPSDLTLQVVDDNSGVPSKTVLASGIISASLITSNYGYIEGYFTSNPTLSKGKKYWLMLVATTNASNYYSWGIDTSNAYASGVGMYSTQWNARTPVWTASGGDYDFNTYMGGVVTSLSGVTVNGDAQAMTLSSCTIKGNATYQVSNSCTVNGTTSPTTTAPAPQAFPISDAQMADWESTAASGQVINGDYTIDGKSVYFGPAEVVGNLTITNGSRVYVTGPIWVKGNFTFSNNSVVSLDSSLGNNGTPIIADYPSSTTTKGIISINNNANFTGNGNPNSYPMIISTYSGVGDAINLGNNATTTIFYAPYGQVTIANNASPLQVTAYVLNLNNNAIVNYYSGIQNASFSDGPGGSWKFKSGTYAITR